MNEAIEDLQIRISHQELAIDELNATVARQDQLIVRLQRDLKVLQEVVKELRPSPLGADLGNEPPPPHY